MVRVLQIIGSMNYGGAETLIMNIYRTIDKSKVQFDFLVVSNGAYDEEIKKLGGRILFRETRRNGLSKYHKNIDKFFKENSKNYNAVHCHCSSLTDIYPLIAAKRNGIKNLFIHSHNTYQKGFVHNVLNTANKLKIKKYSTKRFACSTGAGKYVFGNNVDFELLKNGIIATKYYYNTDMRFQKRKELNLNDSDKVILHVGRFVEEKNQTFLIDILEELLKENKDFKLILVGEGKTKIKIIQKVADKNFEDKVLFLEKRNDVNEILQVADIFVFPSLYEGLPLAGIEAQTAGLPVITSENVSRELDVTGLVKFYSLNCSAKEWAKQIVEILNNTKRKNESTSIKESGYDIEETSRILESYYLN